MQNLVVHIVLPKGIRTVSGAALTRDVTFDVISELTPYYASVDQVRLEGGPLIRRLSDITLACMIYRTSQRANLLCPRPPTGGGDDQIIFEGARNQWVALSAARDLTLNMNQLLGQKGAHVLANFSVTRQGPANGEGIAAGLAEMKKEIDEYEISLRSHGRVLPGGKPGFLMAAKGLADWTEQSPGRTWIANGMGINAKSAPGVNSVGGRGKAAGFARGPYGNFVSGPVLGYGYGMHFGDGRPLPVTMAPHPGIL